VSASASAVRAPSQSANVPAIEVPAQTQMEGKIDGIDTDRTLFSEGKVPSRSARGAREEFEPDSP